MSFFDLFKRQRSAPVARERLQILLAHERGASSGKQNLIALLREEILAVVAKHVNVDAEKVQVKMDSDKEISTLEVEIEIPGWGEAKAA